MPTIYVSTLDPATTIVVATGNAHKITEIEAILAPVMPGVAFFAIGELGDFPEPVEDCDTFAENALIKARAAHNQTGLPAIADDSGLVVDALNGKPGVMSARWAGVHGDDARNNAKLIREMAGVLDAKRSARFCSSVVLVHADGSVTTGEGVCEGWIGFEARGQRGFGYDPLFWPTDAAGRTMAELEPSEKNALSHRARALADLARHLG